MGDNKTNILVGAFLILLMAICVIGGYWIGLHVERDVPEKIVVKDKIVKDTIIISKPVVRDSIVVRREKIRVPVTRTDTITRRDTVVAEIPITQKVYADSSYKAWVSGYLPSLDSISVVQRERIKEVTITKHSNRRLSVGVQAGYGFGLLSKEVQPYVGIGVSWRIW